MNNRTILCKNGLIKLLYITNLEENGAVKTIF